MLLCFNLFADRRTRRTSLLLLLLAASLSLLTLAFISNICAANSLLFIGGQRRQRQRQRLQLRLQLQPTNNPRLIKLGVFSWVAGNEQLMGILL